MKHLFCRDKSTWLKFFSQLPDFFKKFVVIIVFFIFISVIFYNVVEYNTKDEFCTKDEAINEYLCKCYEIYDNTVLWTKYSYTLITSIITKEVIYVFFIFLVFLYISCKTNR